MKIPRRFQRKILGFLSLGITVPYDDDTLTGGLTVDKSALYGYFALVANFDSLLAQLNANPQANVFTPAGGTADDAARLTALIASIDITGTGVGSILCVGGNFAFKTPVMQRSSVIVQFDNGSTVNVSHAGSVFTSPTTGVLYRAGVIGGTFNTGAAVKLFETFSAYQCVYVGYTVVGASTTSIICDLLVNTTGATNPSGNRNSAFNIIGNATQEGSCGDMIRMMGNSTGPTVVTENAFFNIAANGVCNIGFNEHSWCDNNYGYGYNRYNGITAGAVGRNTNSGSPGSDVGVYATQFQSFQFDAFGVIAGDARVGWKAGKAKNLQKSFFYQDPVAVGGQFVFTVNTNGYNFLMNETGTDFIRCVTDEKRQIYRLNDGANFERLNFHWVSNDFLMFTSNGGTGVVREIKFGVGGAAQWKIGNTGNFLCDTDAGFDIGNSATFRPASGYFAKRLVSGLVTVTYSASMTFDAALGNDFVITDTNAVAFTINAPTNATTGQVVTVTVRNASGGALGAATWDPIFKLAAWANPANAFSRSISYRYNGTNWVEISRTPADVPN